MLIVDEDVCCWSSSFRPTGWLLITTCVPLGVPLAYETPDAAPFCTCDASSVTIGRLILDMGNMPVKLSIGLVIKEPEIGDTIPGVLSAGVPVGVESLSSSSELTGSFSAGMFIRFQMCSCFIDPADKGQRRIAKARRAFQNGFKDRQHVIP